MINTLKNKIAKFDIGHFRSGVNSVLDKIEQVSLPKRKGIITATLVYDRKDAVSTYKTIEYVRDYASSFDFRLISITASLASKYENHCCRCDAIIEMEVSSEEELINAIDHILYSELVETCSHYDIEYTEDLSNQKIEYNLK